MTSNSNSNHGYKQQLAQIITAGKDWCTHVLRAGRATGPSVKELLNDDENVFVKGVLRKRSSHLHANRDFKWRLVFVVLYGDTVYYFEDESSDHPVGSFSLVGYNQISRLHPSESQPHEAGVIDDNVQQRLLSSQIFHVVPAHYKECKTYTFQSLQSQDTKMWMDKFNVALYKANKMHIMEAAAKRGKPKPRVATPPIERSWEDIEAGIYEEILDAPKSQRSEFGNESDEDNPGTSHDDAKAAVRICGAITPPPDFPEKKTLTLDKPRFRQPANGVCVLLPQQPKPAPPQLPPKPRAEEPLNRSPASTVKIALKPPKEDHPQDMESPHSHLIRHQPTRIQTQDLKPLKPRNMEKGSVASSAQQMRFTWSGSAEGAKTALLQDPCEGVYLVRDSGTDAQAKALAVIYDGDVTNVRLYSCPPANWWSFNQDGSGQSFPTIDALLHYYCTNPMLLGKKKIMLTRPVCHWQMK